MKETATNKSTFIISVDLELAWGFVQYPTHRGVKVLEKDDKKGRGAVDLLLRLFEKYEIPATWAIVGHLFLDHCECEDGVAHRNMPKYKKDWYHCDPCTDIKRDPLYYGRDIIEKILSSRVEHEIGYHSFSHVPFSECSREVAEAEIKEGVKLAKEFGITLKSFVFPENKIGHIDILKENGFEIYRGRNFARSNMSQTFLTHNINRAIDRLIAPPTEPKWMDGIFEIPSSMYFWDVPSLQWTLLPRAKRGIEKAIRTGAVFHVFLHDWNLVCDPKLGKYLDRLLKIVSSKREEGELQVLTIGGLATLLKRGNIHEC